MAEEIIEQGTEQEPNYIEQIEQLRANSVSKEKYNKLVAEHNKAMNALINGGQLEQKPVEKRSAEEVRKELFNGDNLSNLRYAELALELRDAVIAEGGIDPFVPQGKKIKATREDYESAEMVADGLRRCIEYADGDSEVFTNELQRITDDVVINRRGYR